MNILELNRQAVASYKAKVAAEGSEKEFKLEIDTKARNNVVVRFLPYIENEELQTFRTNSSHLFQNGNGWFFENCPTTIGEKCPSCESLKTLPNKVSKEREKHERYYMYLKVIKDRYIPKNNGKILIYKCNRKLFDLINKTPYGSPFDVENGGNFTFDVTPGSLYKGKHLRVFEESGYLSGPSLFEDLDVIETLKPITFEYKTYNEILEKMSTLEE